MLAPLFPNLPESFKTYITMPDLEGVVLFSHREYEFNSFGPSPNWDELLAFVNEKNIPLHIITNGFSTNSYPKLDLTDTLYRNIKTLEYWPTFLFTTIYDVYRYGKSQSMAITADPYGLDANKDFLYLYITYVYRPRNHRCLMFDKLHENSEIFDKGAIAWSGLYPEWYSGPNAGYTFTSWNPMTLALTERSGETDLLLPPSEYDNSFIHIVQETTDHVIFFTEKIVSPLLFNKLFLVLAAKGYHVKLAEYGFELYTELFDYDFDQQDQTLDRVNGIIDNLNKYKDKSPQELKDIYLSVKDKIARNKQRAIEIATDVESFPPMIKSMCESHDPMIQNLDIYRCYWLFKK